jgi:hypothetical protein
MNITTDLIQQNHLLTISNNAQIIQLSIWDRLIFAIIICLTIKYGLKVLKQEFPEIQIKIDEMKIWLIGLLKNKKNI